MPGPTTTPQLPGYRDLAPLGHGGYSVVYRAYQDQFDRWVAVKLLTVPLADDSAQRRFLRECQMAGRLSAHPNIVTVYDAGLSPDGRPYLAMELFDRGSIADRLRTGGPLEVADALHIAVALAGALETAHRAGVVHRDVKPGNVLLAAYGQPALTDFGLSILAERTEISAGLDALTPYHAAPEVLQGSTATLASDVYSLASTTYAALAGRAPHQRVGDEGSIASLLLRSIEAEIPPTGRPDVPHSLDEALGRALARDPHARTPSALAFAHAAQQVQAELGLEVTEPVVIDAPGNAGPSPAPAALETTVTSVTRRAGSPGSADKPAVAPDGRGAVPDLTFGFGASPAALAGDATVVRPRRPGGRIDSEIGGPGAPAGTPDRGDPAGGSRPGDPAGGPYPGSPVGGPIAPVDASTVPPGGPGARGGPTVDPAVTQGGQWTRAAQHHEPSITQDGQRSLPDQPIGTPSRRRHAGLVLVVVLALVGVVASGAYLTLRAQDGEASDAGTAPPKTTVLPTPTPESTAPPATEPPPAATDIQVPAGLTATESDAGVQLAWDGDPQAHYTVLVLSETESPTVMPAESGTSLLVPEAALPGTGYCFSVARLDSLMDAPAQQSTEAFSPPECIRGAAQDTVRTE